MNVTENKPIERTEEKSQEQAELIMSIAIYIHLLDTEYCKKAAEDMISDANRQQAMSVLYSAYQPKKTEILATKGRALTKLCEYVEILKEIQKMEAELIAENAQRA
jgi:hypothetical protein